MTTELEKLSYNLWQNAAVGGLTSAAPALLSGALEPLEEGQSRAGTIARNGLIEGALGAAFGAIHPGTPGRVFRDAGVGAAMGAIPLGLMGAFGENDQGMSPLHAAAYMGSVGATSGSLLGKAIGPYAYAYAPPHTKGKAPPPTPQSTDPRNVDWLKGVNTKAEAKKRYRAEAMKHHPDRGGDVRKMQDLNDLWDRVQNHPNFQKWACLRGYRVALAQYGC